MEPVKCSTCGKELEIGDYPFCPHESIYGQQAQRFDPIVLHRDPSTGEYSVPGRSNDPVPAGYEKVEITNIRQADKIVREMDRRASHDASIKQDMNRQFFDEQRKAHREQVDAEMRRRGLDSGRARMLRDKVRAWADKQQEVRRARKGNPNTHFQVFAFDRSNRMPHSSRETGYRDRHS